jgi:hypothetical protein
MPGTSLFHKKAFLKKSASILSTGVTSIASASSAAESSSSRLEWDSIGVAARVVLPVNSSFHTSSTR